MASVSHYCHQDKIPESCWLMRSVNLSEACINDALEMSPDVIP